MWDRRMTGECASEVWRQKSRMDCERVAHSKTCSKFRVGTMSSTRISRYVTTQPRWGRGRVGRSWRAVYISVPGLRAGRHPQSIWINKFVCAGSKLILGCRWYMFLGSGKPARKLPEEACELISQRGGGQQLSRWWYRCWLLSPWQAPWSTGGRESERNLLGVCDNGKCQKLYSLRIDGPAPLPGPLLLWSLWCPTTSGIWGGGLGKHAVRSEISLLRSRRVGCPRHDEDLGPWRWRHRWLEGSASSRVSESSDLPRRFGVELHSEPRRLCTNVNPERDVVIQSSPSKWTWEGNGLKMRYFLSFKGLE